MADVTERELTALHEAAHAVVAHALGCTPGLLTVDAGRAATGWMRWSGLALPCGMPASTELPLAAWPADWRRWAEVKALVAIAGDMAERICVPRAITAPPSDTVTAPLSERPAGRVAEAAVELPPATAAEREVAAAAVNDEKQRSDAAELAHVAWLVHGQAPERREAWLRWLREECRALLGMHEERVHRLAAAALKAGTLGADAVGRLLDADR